MDPISLQCEGIVGKLRRCSREIAITTMLEALAGGAMFAIFAILQIISLHDVAAVVEIIARHILAVESMVILHRFLPHKLAILRECRRDRSDISGIQ